MNKKLMFRIIGALASALIIIGVFVPFISVTGYSVSLWELFSRDSIYLPITLIVFGVIGIVFFALNIKTEFAYMSTGAVAFFIIMQTIDIINQDGFSTLGVGYYFLVIGTIITGLMAFLTNLKSKSNTINGSGDVSKNPNIIEQIDKLYDDKSAKEEPQVKSVDSVIEPMPAIQPINPMPQDNNITNIEPQPINPVAQENTVQEQSINPVVQEFVNNNMSQQVSIQEPQIAPNTSNPVVQGFVNDKMPSVQEQPMTPNASNPVVQDLMNPNTTPVQPQNTSSTDIFGQPINKS